MDAYVNKKTKKNANSNGSIEEINPFRYCTFDKLCGVGFDHIFFSNRINLLMETKGEFSNLGISFEKCDFGAEQLPNFTAQGKYAFLNSTLILLLVARVLSFGSNVRNRVFLKNR